MTKEQFDKAVELTNIRIKLNGILSILNDEEAFMGFNLLSKNSTIHFDSYMEEVVADAVKSFIDGELVKLEKEFNEL